MPTSHIIQNTPYNNDSEYLNDELRWIAIRSKRIVIQSGNPSKNGTKNISLNEKKEFIEASLLKEAQLRADIEARLEVTTGLRFFEVCETYSLNDLEKQLLLLCIAIALSTEHEKEFINIDEQYGEPTIAGLFIFLNLPYNERFEARKLLTKNSTLIANDILSIHFFNRFNNNKDMLRGSLEVNNQIFHHIMGLEDCFEEFEEYSSLETPKSNFSQIVIPPKDKQKIQALIRNRSLYLERREEWGFNEVITYGKGTFILFSGPPGTGKTMTAHAIADDMGKKILNVDIPTLINENDSDKIIPSLFRLARLQNAILFFDECETFFASRMRGNNLVSILLTEMERFDGVAILATNLPQWIDESVHRRLMLKIHFSVPDIKEREAIWRLLIPAKAPIKGTINYHELAQRFELTGGYIKNAVLYALSECIHEGGSALEHHHLEKGAQNQISNSFQGKDVILATHSLEKVILPRRTKIKVDQLIHAVQKRRQVYEKWGLDQHLSYGKGIVGLLHGPPGVGKTYTAEAISFELSRPMITVSPSEILSKWVGESEKTLTEIFERAQKLNAVLFIDEADSFLTARERIPNHQISLSNLLLSKLERHDGVVLLATNRVKELDSALSRRIQYKIPFVYPAIGERMKIWQNFLSTDIPTSDDINPLTLAQEFTLSGAEIKNVILRCAFDCAFHDTELTQQKLYREAKKEEQEHGCIPQMPRNRNVAKA